MNIAVLLSGGVDSSVALSRLVTAGHRVTAFYLKIWLEDDLAFLGECPWEDDLRYARAVCERWGVPLEVVSLQGAYWERVVAHVVTELKDGRTPSPDILCNERVKFGAFADLLDSGFDKIASGHYARTLIDENDKAWLLRGVDPVKDQTYFLSRLSQTQLSRCLFPIGDLPKAEVRQLAAQWNLLNFDRRDSQGICFLGKIKYADFVKCHLGEHPGEIRELETGRVLGSHNGFWFHTIGQRKGLGLGGGPWFVVHKDIEKNVVYVSHHEHACDRSASTFTVRALHWITRPPLSNEVLVRIRHGERRTAARVTERPDGLWDVEMAEADQGVAPGQYAVFYEGDVCLGSGVISGGSLRADSQYTPTKSCGHEAVALL